MRFILASASPRRKELLEKMGLEFEVVPALLEEIVHTKRPQDVVMELSRQKAEEVATKRDGKTAPELIIGADTVVVYEESILGKPKNEEEAYQMLSMLQGNRHKVYTGVTLVLKEENHTKESCFYEETEVCMCPMSEMERLWYIGTKEPFDKAGGYGIQGRCAVFIKEIHGDYNNVVGLPVARIYQEFLKLGIDIYQKP